MKLRCVNFISQEPGKLAGFYAKVLEAPIQEVVPGRWEVPVGGVTLAFTHTCEKVVVPTDSCGLEFQVEDVDREYVRLCRAGITASSPPVTYPWQWRAFAVRDPDGNNLDFVQFVGDTADT